MTKELDAARTERHPDTGGRLAGFRLPHWSEALALCLKAHASFSAYAYVGWDVAFTDDGPVLVEGNLRWGVESMQRAHYRPLGETLFPETIILHINQSKLLGSLWQREFWTRAKDVVIKT
jgi:hypothetical protein